MNLLPRRKEASTSEKKKKEKHGRPSIASQAKEGKKKRLWGKAAGQKKEEVLTLQKKRRLEHAGKSRDKGPKEETTACTWKRGRGLARPR